MAFLYHGIDYLQSWEKEMLTLVFCLRGREGLSRDEFQRYWRNRHGPLMAKNMAAFDARKYQQWHTASGPVADGINQSRGGPADYDGLAVVWWDDLEHFLTATGTNDGREMSKDELTFIDLENSPIFMTNVGYEAGGPITL